MPSRPSRSRRARALAVRCVNTARTGPMLVGADGDGRRDDLRRASGRTRTIFDNLRIAASVSRSAASNSWRMRASLIRSATFANALVRASRSRFSVALRSCRNCIARSWQVTRSRDPSMSRTVKLRVGGATDGLVPVVEIEDFISCATPPYLPSCYSCPSHRTSRCSCGPGCTPAFSAHSRDEEPIVADRLLGRLSR